MPCNTCGTSHTSYQYRPNCTSPTYTNAKDIMYTGAALECIEVDPNTDLAAALSKINDAVCQNITIDWSSFDYHCLSTSTTAKEFVEEITGEFCDLKETVTDFTTETFPDYQEDVDERFEDIEVPGTESTCTINSVSIATTDAIQSVLQKLSNITCYLSTQLNPSSANWNTCYATSAPATIVGGFNTIITWICALKTAVDNLDVALPIFDNTASCLASPGETDSLYDTVVKIRDKVCQSVVYDPANVVWQTCIVDPTSSVGTSLEDTITYLVEKLESAYTGRLTSVSSDFTLTETSTGDPCGGLRLELNANIANNKVALDSGDTSPDFLLEKMTAGAGISFDTTTTPGEVIINNTVSDTDEKVKTSAADSTADYLVNKMMGSSDSGITISINEDSTNPSRRAQVTVQVSKEQLAYALLETARDISVVNTLLCSIVSDCVLPATCRPATDVSAHVDYGEEELVFEWTPSPDAVSQLVKLRKVGDSAWSSTASVGPLIDTIVIHPSIPDGNAVYEWYVETTCLAGVSQSYISQFIVFEALDSISTSSTMDGWTLDVSDSTNINSLTDLSATMDTGLAYDGPFPLSSGDSWEKSYVADVCNEYVDGYYYTRAWVNGVLIRSDSDPNFGTGALFDNIPGVTTCSA